MCGPAAKATDFLTTLEGNEQHMAHLTLKCALRHHFLFNLVMMKYLKFN
jgi:hypothetical protein